MWYYICIVIGVVIGWGLFALFVISAENKEIRRLRKMVLRMLPGFKRKCDYTVGCEIEQALKGN